MDDWKDALFREDTLWAVYCQSPGLKGRSFNWYTAIGTFVLLAGFVVLDQCFFAQATPVIDYAAIVRSWASIGFGFSSAILGFLLAGFTVFATITKPRLFVVLAQAENELSGLSELKHVFFSFLNVFSHYLSFLTLTLLINMVGDKGGIASKIASLVTPYVPALDESIPVILFVVVGTWMIILVLKLKSFLWSVYQAVLLSVAHEAQRIGDEEED
ncbi:MAG: hypothetical protein ACPGO3_00055 [Magnetospiraceae bacterium]